MKDEPWWPRPTLVQFRWTIECKKNVNNNVTVCFSNVSKESFCLLLGFSFYLLSENKHVCFLNATTKTRNLSYMLRHIECAFETWNLNTKKRIRLVIVHSRILCMGRKFRNSQQRKKKLKTKKKSWQEICWYNKIRKRCCKSRRN